MRRRRCPTLAAWPPPTRLPTHRDRVADRRRTQPPAFPGCKPVRLPRDRIDRFEGRLEYWDAATETAWICEPTTPYHERPSRLLTKLAALIAQVRGSPIECYGFDGPAAARLPWRAAAHHAGRRVGVPASGARQAAAGARHGGRRARLSRRGAGSGPHHGRAPGQAPAVRVVGIPGSVGGGAGRAVAEPAARTATGADDSSVGGRSLPGGGREPGVSRLAGGRDPRGAERADAVGADQCGGRAGGSGARRP